MRIALAADHAGFDLKQQLARHLRDGGHEVDDLGTHDRESTDYPDFAARVARAVAAGEAERGVLVCGTGAGMAMAANRHRGVRAVATGELAVAQLARRHNDANVLALGARLIAAPLAEEVLDTFLSTPFDGGRHARRVAKMDGAGE
jgi:ribose 5-phosphate isomerase B